MNQIQWNPTSSDVARHSESQALPGNRAFIDYEMTFEDELDRVSREEDREVAIENGSYGVLAEFQAGWSEIFEDGKVTRDEFTDTVEIEGFSKVELEAVFDRFDWDRNGELSPAEFEAAMRYIVDRVKQKLEQKEERQREQAQQQMAVQAGEGAISAKGNFINNVCGKSLQNSATNDDSKKSANKARSPIRNSLELVKVEADQ